MAKLNTAKYREMAYEAEQRGDFERARKLYGMAAKVYPRDQLKGELGQADLANLRKRARW